MSVERGQSFSLGEETLERAVAMVVNELNVAELCTSRRLKE